MTGPVQPAGSRAKVIAALDQAERLGDDPEAPGAVRMAVGFLAMARGQIEAQLPASDEKLDELLDRGSQWMQSLKSDPQPVALDV